MALGEDVKYGACSERLIVKIWPTGRQSQVPARLFAAGSVSGPGQVSGPPAWLHDIAESSPAFWATVENDCVAATSVVSVMRRAWVRPRISAFVTKRPCSLTSA